MRVTFLFDGNSANINEWSNVPYFLTEGFKANGCEINRVNMHIKAIGQLYDMFVTKIAKFFMKDTTFCFQRSKLRAFLMDLKMRWIMKKHSNEDIYFVIADNLNPYKYTTSKCIMLTDWTYEFEIVHDQNKRIDRLERYFHDTQIEMMKKAYANIVMRAECQDYIMDKYEDIYVCPFDNNVVHCLLENVDENEILQKKIESNIIIFLGAKRYIKGAEQLLACIKQNYKLLKKYEFHFIGINENDVKTLDLKIDNCFFEGYLYKGNLEEMHRYYELLSCAKICINTNDNFVSIASLIEAGYLYTPAIISRNYQTVKCYGEDKSFKRYCLNEPQDILKSITFFADMNENEYKKNCIASRKYFEQKTWKQVIATWIENDFGKRA